MLGADAQHEKCRARDVPGLRFRFDQEAPLGRYVVPRRESSCIMMKIEGHRLQEIVRILERETASDVPPILGERQTLDEAFAWAPGKADAIRQEADGVYDEHEPRRSDHNSDACGGARAPRPQRPRAAKCV